MNRGRGPPQLRLGGSDGGKMGETFRSPSSQFRRDNGKRSQDWNDKQERNPRSYQQHEQQFNRKDSFHLEGTGMSHFKIGEGASISGGGKCNENYMGNPGGSYPSYSQVNIEKVSKSSPSFYHSTLGLGGGHSTNHGRPSGQPYISGGPPGTQVCGHGPSHNHNINPVPIQPSVPETNQEERMRSQQMFQQPPFMCPPPTIPTPAQKSLPPPLDSLQHPPPLHMPPPHLLPPPPFFSLMTAPPQPVPVPRFPPPSLSVPPQPPPHTGHLMAFPQGPGAELRMQFPIGLDGAKSEATQSGTGIVEKGVQLLGPFGNNALSVPAGLTETAADSRMQRVKEGAGAQEEVNRWLEKVLGKSTSSLSQSIPAEKCERKRILKTVSIPEAHKILHTALHSLAAVQGALNQLQEKLTTADSAEWEEAVGMITRLKEDYLKAKELVNVKHFAELKEKLEMRRKKRMRQKKHKEEEKEEKEQLLYERAQKHSAIDQWRHHIQQENLKQKQVKEMKLAADKTLGKVVREIREARKMLETLAGLKKLRAIRSDAAEKRGQLFPSTIGEHFNSKIDDLMELLKEQAAAHEKEEAALKLIVQTEQAEAREKEIKAQRQLQKEQQEQGLLEDFTSLFGPEVVHFNNSPMLPFEQFYQQACLHLPSLLAIREAWDSFLVPEETPGSSRIPDGWVEPEPPSSSVWASALKTS